MDRSSCWCDSSLPVEKAESSAVGDVARRRAARRGPVALVAAGLMILAGCAGDIPEPASAPKPNSGLREVELSIAGKKSVVEVADTDAARQRGLMYRQSLPQDRGMLFVFPESDYRAFYMKNVAFPLDIAFLREDGTIDEIKHMKAATLDRTYSQHRVRYALEINFGWFESSGIGPGDRVDLSPLQAQ